MFAATEPTGIEREPTRQGHEPEEGMSVSTVRTTAV